MTAATAPEPVLVVRDLAIDTRHRRIGPFDVTVGAGEIVGLVGPNGSGKTSCLRLALGLDPATDGSSRLHGVTVGPRRPPVGVGLVLEADACFGWLSGHENLRVFADALGRPRREIDQRLDEAGLGPAADRVVRSYSRGMRQRLAVARARLGDPALLVLDEPTVALDDAATAWLADVLVAHAAAGGAALVASHDRAFLDAIGARLVVVDRGSTR